MYWVGEPGIEHRTYIYDDANLATTEVVQNSYVSDIVSQVVQRFNGLGLVRREETRAEESTWNVVETQYDALGRLWKQTQPFRAGEQMYWSERLYDGLGRLTVLRSPDGSEFRNFYDEAVRPAGASSNLGERVRSVDAAGRERLTHTDALGRLSEVVEPAPDGDGSVFRPGHMVTYYSWNALDRLEGIQQGAQIRRFRYDSLGRLTHQALPEKLATLNDVGAYVGSSGQWSDIFVYDDRSNLISRTDARGVKTIFDYQNDPLNRVQTLSYDISDFGDSSNPILPAASVSYEYMTAGDVTRLRRVTTNGISTEEYGYDTRGRLSSKTLIMASRPSHPLVIDYVYDSTFDRLTDVRYPAEYGVPEAPRRSLHYGYGVGSRPRDLAFGGVAYASEIAHNAAGQATSLKIGPGGPYQLIESFGYDSATGWLDHQQVQRAGAPLLDLSYKYGRPGRRTGQLTGIVNNLVEGFNPAGLRAGGFTWAYHYDALGRLKRLAGISFPTGHPGTDTIATIGKEQWSQAYSYDRFGNRTAVTLAQEVPSFTVEPWTPLPRDGLAALSYDPSTNRLTTAGFEYDAAGNLTRSPRSDGTWQRLQYDAAGRLARVFEDMNLIEGTHFPIRPVVGVETYTYGADRRRLVAERGTFEPTAVEGESGFSIAPPRVPRPLERTYYAWNGDSVIAEYTEAEVASWELRWSRSYVYLGERLLATLLPGSEEVLVRYSHPDRLGPRLLTHQADGTVTQQITFPYGTVLDAHMMATSGRIFATYDRNLFTGLDYAVNRYYDSRLGRFAQVDPLDMQAMDLRDPQDFNLYAYVRNDPANATDPLSEYTKFILQKLATKSSLKIHRPSATKSTA